MSTVIRHGTILSGADLRRLILTQEYVWVTQDGHPTEMPASEAVELLEDGDAMTLACGGGYTPHLHAPSPEGGEDTISLSSFAQEDDPRLGWFIRAPFPLAAKEG